MNATVKFDGKSARVGNNGSRQNSNVKVDGKTDESLMFPMEPKKALECFSKYMMEFEKQEMLNYETIYFFDIKKKRNDDQ